MEDGDQGILTMTIGGTPASVHDRHERELFTVRWILVLTPHFTLIRKLVYVLLDVCIDSKIIISRVPS